MRLDLPLAESFAAEAVDVDTMLAWKDVKAELIELGVTQRGVISKIANAIEEERQRRSTSSVANVASSFFSNLFATATEKRANISEIVAAPPSPSASVDEAPQPSITTALDDMPSGDHFIFDVSFGQASIIPAKGSLTWGAMLTRSFDLYVRCDARYAHSSLVDADLL